MLEWLEVRLDVGNGKRRIERLNSAKDAECRIMND